MAAARNLDFFRNLLDNGGKPSCDDARNVG
jgi:hypothetical protein